MTYTVHAIYSMISSRVVSSWDRRTWLPPMDTVNAIIFHMLSLPFFLSLFTGADSLRLFSLL